MEHEMFKSQDEITFEYFEGRFLEDFKWLTDEIEKGKIWRHRKDTLEELYQTRNKEVQTVISNYEA